MIIRSRYFGNRFLTVSTRPRPRLYMCLVDLDKYLEILVLSSASDTTPSTFVVDHNLTIPQSGTHFLRSLGGFMCCIFKKKPWIFNPATRQLVTLPEEEGDRYFSYYFGLDPVNGQYKVVCSTSAYFKHLQEIRSEHWVFALKPGRGTWKRVAPDFCPHKPVRQGLCIDGVIYYPAWIVDGNYVFVSFHIRSKEFKAIQVPSNWRSQNFDLINYGGKLARLDYTDLRDKGMFDLWVLEDAANQEWSRKSLVLQTSQLHLVNNTTFYVGCTTQSGKLLLKPLDFISPFHILCYDLQNNDMRKIEIKGIPDHWFSKEKRTTCFGMMFMDQSESVMHLET